jgi:hypothetical protein
MTALYFGPSESPLFGYLHRPSGPVRGGVVLCPALSIEGRFSHSTLVWLGVKFAQEGFMALRFDYRGTGDSSGVLLDASVPMWIEDVRCGIAFLRSRLGDTPVHGFGIRTGANLLRMVTAECNEVDRVTYLDPVEDGARWTLTHSRDRSEAPEATSGFAGWKELSERLSGELRDIAWSAPECKSDETALFVSTAPLRSEFGSGWGAQYLHHPGPQAHVEIDQTGIAAVPVAVLREVVSSICP